MLLLRVHKKHDKIHRIMLVKCCFTGCLSQFSSVNNFLEHLDGHRPPSIFHYRCTYPGCQQLFTKTYPFKRHFKLHRFPPVESSSTSTTVESQGVVECSSSGVSILRESTDCSAEPSKAPRIEDHAENNQIRLNQKIKNSTISMTLNLHKRANFSRQDVREVQNAAQEMCTQFAECIESPNVNSNDPETNYHLEQCLNSMKSSFQFINSDFKFFNVIYDQGIFEQPIVIELDDDKCSYIKKPDKESCNRKSCLVINPIHFQVKKFFETSGILFKTLERIKSLEKSTDIRHFVNGRVWKEIIRR